MTHLCKLAAGMGLISARYARFNQAHTGVPEGMLHELSRTAHHTGKAFMSSITKPRSLQVAIFGLVLVSSTVVYQLPAVAAERINSFRSDLVVAADGLLEITETITVSAEGDRIRRGIYRDIPVRYAGGVFGFKASLPFSILSIDYDGMPANFHTDPHGDFTRIYIGRAGVQIPKGQHTYVIRYTTRQLRFFDDHDEVYWNVTGHAWEFPIDEVTATVTFPPAVPLGQVDPEGYVGRLRSTNQRDLTVEVSLNQRQIIYRTTRRLRGNEGLTIVARFPSGIIEAPAAVSGLWEDSFFRWCILGLAVVLGYFLIAWSLVGRDPATGVIVPQYEVPDGLSPAGCRFISQMGYDSKCFSVALLSLATQGALAICEEAGDYTLEKVGTPSPMASPGERKVFFWLLSDRTTLAVDRKYHTRFSRANEMLCRNLEQEFEGALFRPNCFWFYGGVGVALAALVGAAFLGGGMAVGVELAFSITSGLIIFSVGVVATVHTVVSIWRSALMGGAVAGRRSSLGRAGFLTLVAIPIVGAGIFVLGWLAGLMSLWHVPLVLGIVTTVVVFYELLKAPTISGRAIMDRIAGLRMYLATAEQDRLEAHTWQAFHQRQRPPRTLELFEYFLPYAAALDVANQWAEQFRDLIEAVSTEAESGATPGGYCPAWYHGTAWSTASIGAAAAGLGTAMTTAVVAAATSPSASSGGDGGGFSGGGGGGGGGGGW